MTATKQQRNTRSKTLAASKTTTVAEPSSPATATVVPTTSPIASSTRAGASRRPVTEATNTTIVDSRIVHASSSAAASHDIPDDSSPMSQNGEPPAPTTTVTIEHTPARKDRDKRKRTEDTGGPLEKSSKRARTEDTRGKKRKSASIAGDNSSAKKKAKYSKSSSKRKHESSSSSDSSSSSSDDSWDESSKSDGWSSCDSSSTSSTSSTSSESDSHEEEGSRRKKKRLDTTSPDAKRPSSKKPRYRKTQDRYKRPEFDGKPDQDVEKYCDNAKNYLRQYRYSDKEAVAKLKSGIGGVARKALKSYGRKQLKTPKRLLRCLKRTFKPRVRAPRSLHSVKQETNETAALYAQRIRELAHKSKVREKGFDAFCIDFFIEAARTDLKNHLYLYDFDKFRECEKKAIKYEERRNEERRNTRPKEHLATMEHQQPHVRQPKPILRFKSPPPRQPYQAVSTPNIRCHICHELGHGYRVCPKATELNRERIRTTPLEERRQWTSSMQPRYMDKTVGTPPLNYNATSSRPPRVSQ